jgi:AraC-like DNA-binding protein
MRPNDATTAPGPLSRHRVLLSTDVDEVVAGASAFQVPIVASFSRPRRSIRMDLRRMSLGRLGVVHARFDHEGDYEVRAEPLPGTYHLQLPTVGRSRVEHAGRSLETDGEGCGVLLSPGAATTWFSRGGFREITVNLDRRALEKRFGEIAGEEPRRPIAFEPRIDLRTGPGARLRALVGDLLTEIDADAGGGLSNPRVEDLETAVLDAVLLGLAHSHRLELEGGLRRPGLQLVHRAERLLESRAGHPVTIREVARELGVSMRTLQRAFLRYRGASPKVFLQRLRLDRARRALLRPAPRTTVTATAMDSGFGHLGQFSVDYRGRFGESPSETLRRARGA